MSTKEKQLNEKIKVFRQKQYHDRVGVYHTHKVNVVVTHQMQAQLREFIFHGQYSDRFELIDEEPKGIPVTYPAG